MYVCMPISMDLEFKILVALVVHDDSCSATTQEPILSEWGIRMLLLVLCSVFLVVIYVVVLVG